MARKTTQAPLHWLHIADLHLGGRAEADWEQGVDELLRSFASASRPPGLDSLDLVLVTGDIADAGAQDEYERATEFLSRLLGALPRASDGGEPILVPVPGNHDVSRPDEAAALAFMFLSTYSEGAANPHVRFVRDQLWEKRRGGLIEPLFTAYAAWFDDFVAPRLRGRAGVSLHPSAFFPGDLAVRVALPRRPPLHLVGLNTAWLAYREGDYRGALALHPTQLHAALSDDESAPLDALPPDEHALLLLHHRPDMWLLPTALTEFHSAIYPPRRFAACLHGQAPEHTFHSVAAAGGGERIYVPTYSLLGRRTFKKNPEDDPADRRQGYVWGQLRADGEIRVWPRKRFTKGDSVRGFFPDPGVHDGGEGVLVRRGQAPGPARVAAERSRRPAASSSAAAAALRLDLTTYCERVRDRTKSLRLDGIAASAKALNYPIERLYTRLQTHTHHIGQGARNLGATAPRDPARRGPVDLGELLARRRPLLIEGQAGSGKTTFLRLAASLLARDSLGEPCPDEGGPTWRAAHLSERVPAKLPIFLKLSQLADLGEPAAQTNNQRNRGDVLLLDHLAAETAPASGEAPDTARARRQAWADLLHRGEALLLLDGLDEVGDPDRREHVFAALREILSAWPECQVVVSSRPFGAERELLIQQLGFVHTSVAPFTEAEVRDYGVRWAHALHENDPDKLAGEPEEAFASELTSAIRARRELRRLASSPVMLTCLCVVYSHGGGLPDSRAELYRDAIRWLIVAREKLRREAGYGGIRVQEALSALALAMMGGSGTGKRRELALRDAADVVAPIVRGPAVDHDDPPTRRELLCAWLRFECEHSGVIEEVGRGQLQFKHLTFQEYLAAARLASSSREVWWSVLSDKLEDLQWRETVELFPGCLLDPSRGATEDADFLVREVHGLWPERPPLVRAATVTAITGRFDPAFRCASYEPPRDVAEDDARLRAQVEAIFTEDGAAEVEEKTRVAAAEAIGVAGDRRLAPERFERNLLPVPVGGRRVNLGKYPVTVEEFARFVEDGGYRRAALWVDDEGWAFRTREGWEEPDWWEMQLGTPNRPVVGVSWFEAMAYCRWLTADHPHLRVRLPTQEEWMAAASPDGRRYPWGSEPEPDALRANFGERIDDPTPVGIYPAGDGVFEHCDLAGNVWEWSLDIGAEIESSDEQIEAWGSSRLLCGGAYWSDKDGVAAAVRVGLGSDYRDFGFGFRVVAERASP